MVRGRVNQVNALFPARRIMAGADLEENYTSCGAHSQVVSIECVDSRGGQDSRELFGICVSTTQFSEDKAVVEPHYLVRRPPRRQPGGFFRTDSSGGMAATLVARLSRTFNKPNGNTTPAHAV
jgi:hypothetical protein